MLAGAGCPIVLSVCHEEKCVKGGHLSLTQLTQHSVLTKKRNLIFFFFLNCQSGVVVSTLRRSWVQIHWATGVEFACSSHVCVGFFLGAVDSSHTPNICIIG